MKKLALCLGFVALTALVATSAVGCDSNGNNSGDDMAMSGGGDMAMQGNQPDMSFVCVMNPMMGDDFLNSCAPASVASVDITPFYPTLAPNGQLPPLN